MDKKKLLDNALSNYAEYCQGFGFSGVNNSSYILTPLLAVGKDKLKFFHQGSTLLDEINAFDQAEVDSAYIGQINLIQVSSFCGPAGLLWGYDLAVSDIEKPLDNFAGVNYTNIRGDRVAVYSAWPLIEATRHLFGTRDAKIFPLLPGSHVPAASKAYSLCNLPPAEEVKHLYCSLALGIPADRDKDAVLLMEDIGWAPRHGDKPDFREQYDHVLDSLVRSVLQIGENQNVTYTKVYAALKEVAVDPGEVGCALVVAPYISLAQNAIPPSGTAQMLNMSLAEWQSQVGRQPFADFQVLP